MIHEASSDATFGSKDGFTAIAASEAASEPLPNVAYLQQRRAERIVSSLGVVAFFTLAVIVIAMGLPFWLFPAMIAFGILVPIWILLVRQSTGPVTFRVEPLGLRLEFVERYGREWRSVPWTAVQIVVEHRKAPKEYWLRLPVHPVQTEKEEWLREPSAHAERITWPNCFVAVDEALWQQIAPHIPADAKFRLNQSSHL